LLTQSQTTTIEATTFDTFDSPRRASSYPRHPTCSKVIRTNSFVLKIIRYSPTTYSLKAKPTIQLIMAEVAAPSSSPPMKQYALTKSQLEVPDDEVQRGRKRRRSSNNSPPPHLTSNGSTTLRGRARRRSPSFTLSDSFERVRSPSPGNEKRKSPGRKYAKRDFLKEKKRRSQSLSRSRTRGTAGDEREETVKPRRRQRTRSRSRKHGEREVDVERDGAEKEHRRDSAVEIDEEAVED